MKLARLIVALLALGLMPGQACTIFVLTDADRALFFNNEDWFNRETRLWFVPAGKDHLGCAYVGFNDGWAQGGVNSAGLAFDWVSGFEEAYQPDPKLQRVRGNPSQRMLETCTTVDEAIAFYQKFLEPDFKRSRTLVADRSGASAVVGSLNGKLHVVRLQQSRGFGYGRLALERELAKSPEPTLANGAAILRACLQPGDGGTKYSSVYDLKRGELVLFPSPDRDESVVLNLATELAKGGHFYEMTKIREQLAAPPQPLINNMKRFYLDEFIAVADREPAVTERIRRLLVNIAAGAIREDDFTPGFWQKIAPQRQDFQAGVQQLGDLRSLSLVGRGEEMGARGYRYLVEFTKARVLVHYVLDQDDKIALILTEAVEAKPVE